MPSVLGIAPARGKCYKKHSTHFPSENKEDFMLNKSLIQGSLSMLILRLLDEKDMYGYEMIETLRKRSENVFELKAGSLYPLLHALEANNLVTAYEDDASGKMRKYYHITGEGKRILKEKKDEWNTYAAAVTNVLSCKAMEMCI